MILAASSPFFQNLLKRNKHPHPLIFMRGVKSEDLSAILDFLYSGEANVNQENLESFLAIAEELKLQGLMATNQGQAETSFNNDSMESKTPANKGEPIRKDISSTKAKVEKKGISKAIAIPFVSGGVLEDLDLQVKSMMEKSQNLVLSGKRRADKCKVCGKEGETMAIKDHIEANHLEEICIPCKACDKTFKSRYSLRMHRAKMTKLNNATHF